MHAPTPRRVAHVLGNSSGGIRRHVRYLAQNPPEGYCTVAVLGPPSVAEYFAGLPFQAWDSKQPWRKYLPDIIHAHGLTAGVKTLRSAGLLSGRPAVVVTVHTSQAQTLRSQLPGASLEIVQKTLWAAARSVIGRADAVIAVSEEVAGQVGATHTVPPAVDLLPGPAQSREQTRAALGTPEDAVVVLAVGRLHPDKSLHVFIDALRSKDAEGWVAGEGPDRNRLEALAEGSNVRLLGHRDDVPTLLAAADIFALPTAAESYGFAAMEAVASGLPVVCTRTGSIPQIVGNAGLLVSAGDAAGFQNALHRLIDSSELRSELAANARNRHLPAPEELVARVGEVYDEVVLGRA